MTIERDSRSARMQIFQTRMALETSETLDLGLRPLMRNSSETSYDRNGRRRRIMLLSKKAAMIQLRNGEVANDEDRIAFDRSEAIFARASERKFLLQPHVEHEMLTHGLEIKFTIFMQGEDRKILVHAPIYPPDPNIGRVETVQPVPKIEIIKFIPRGLLYNEEALRVGLQGLAHLLGANPDGTTKGEYSVAPPNIHVTHPSLTQPPVPEFEARVTKIRPPQSTQEHLDYLDRVAQSNFRRA